MQATTTEYRTAAQTAKAVRQALKANFPGVKFSVRSRTYAGGASIDISWVDGPTQAAVEAIANRYQGADFDGMQDLKTHREPTLLAGADGELRAVSWGADYIFCRRTFGVELMAAAAASVAQRYGVQAPAIELSEHFGAYVERGRADEILGGAGWDPYWTLANTIRRELEEAAA